MKKNYIKFTNSLIISAALLVCLVSNAQDIHFTFANAQNTNDGSFDYYEVDVMIQTINTTGSFKLGSGQLYFTYSTTAFGTNIKANAAITVTQPNPNYIAGQFIDAAPANIYGSFTTNDNTTSRVSWAFSQAFSRSTFAADNVSATPAKLCHLKLKYIDVNQAPAVLFEDGIVYDDQFYTACGLDAGGAFGGVDCGTEPGIQLVNDTFDSNGATLSNQDFKLLIGISVYPNPTKGMLYLNGDLSKLRNIEIYSMTGQRVMEVKSNFNGINLETLRSAIYFLKINTLDATGTLKIVKE